MRRLLLALAFAGAGYLGAALAGYALTLMLSANAHDRELEAVMSAAFFWGPLGALVGALAGFMRRRAEPMRDTAPPS